MKKKVMDKRFFSYYKPYLGLFLMDMLCALIVAGISLIYPLIIRYITNDVLPNTDMTQGISVIIRMALVMVGLVLICLLYTSRCV